MDQQPARHALPYTKNFLQHFRRLHGAHDPGHGTQYTARGTGWHGAVGGRFGEYAAIAGMRRPKMSLVGG